MVFNKIFVALDRSDQAPTVVKQALALAQVPSNHLMLFHCLNWNEEQLRPFVGIGTLSDINLYSTEQSLRHESLQRDIEQVQVWLQGYQQQAKSLGIFAESDCRLGSPGASICEQAQNWGANLIVLGRRGHSGLSELLLGSVSNYVVHHASCSVLIVQGRKTNQT